ncbi:hypothetical protein GN244_ATG19234 [Phytophthora infestans]|uniref:Uncharacterized protein n=1 Tax=Phytophthora infestans TaxID=4787 RepID=A0A833S554_PHYIN|nr:hypothetical protein GN244_ATG19234 [Phytophthora infestans]
MADSHRPKVSTPSSTYGVIGGTPRLAASKNQQSPRESAQTAVLPRIDRPQKPHANLSNSVRSGGRSILLPPRRPPSKDATPNEEISRAFHGEALEGPSTKAAWCTPRNLTCGFSTGSHVVSFFSAAEASSRYDDTAVRIPTPLRLQSFENSINANEERYRVNMEQLTSNNDKFLEISMSANQHLEQMHSQLPNISEVFGQTASALHSLSTDITTLHEQHESAKNGMAIRFEAAMNYNAEEVASLSEMHANEKAELVEALERDLEIAAQIFREKSEQMEERFTETEKKYLDDLQKLRLLSESKMEVVQESNRAEKEEMEQSAKAALEELNTKAQAALDEARSSSQTAYTDLQQRSQAAYSALQLTSADELAAVKKALTTEMLSLKENAAATFAALADRSERQLQEHRERSNEALQQLKRLHARERDHLLEKAAEETARLRMFEIEQSTRMEDHRCRETKALSEELESTKTELSSQINHLHRRYTSELEVLKATSGAERNLLLQAHAEETEDICSAAAQELSWTLSSYQDKLASMMEAHAAEMTRNKEKTALAREALVTMYESDLELLQNERAREKDALVRHHETELKSLKRSSTEEHDKTVKLYEAQVMQLREAHASRVLSLEMTMREQKTQAEDALREKETELETRQERIDALEASGVALNERHEVYFEQCLELVERKNMALAELESNIWRLDQSNLEKEGMLDSTNWALKAAEEGVQVKANTILELTFVVKSRDDEIEKLRNALLDTVQTVNSKTEILELTTETLSSKAKELEVTKNALRLESGKLSMAKESMNQKVEMLENSELNLERMRLNMENMRLEIKRIQMEMKLQLEHTEGEIDLKNGEIRRLHGTKSELIQKNDYCQQTIVRLEESLAFAQRQGEKTQRRMELLRLETAQASDETKTVCDELLDKEQELVIITREKQTITMEKQRLEIQFNDLSQVNETLKEKVELHRMQAEEIHAQYQILLKETVAANEERLRSEKHLHLLKLSVAKDTIRHLEGVEGRLGDTTSRLEAVMKGNLHLHAEIKMLTEALKNYKDTDRQLDAANQEIKQKDKRMEDKSQQLDDLNKRLCKSGDEAQHLLDTSRMEIEDWMSDFYRLACSKDEIVQLNQSLESSLSVENEQLLLLLGQEKREIVSQAEDLQERIAGLRKEGAQAASNIIGLQHALSEKKKELEYLQEILGKQTTDIREIKATLKALSSAHFDLQTQFSSSSNQRQKENEEHQITIQSLQQDLENKTKQCETLQQSLDIQRQKIDLPMVQHDRDVMQLTDGHCSEAVQLIESHRAQIAQMTEDYLDQINKLKEEHFKVTEKRQRESTRLADQGSEHQSDISRITEEHQSEIARLKNVYQTEIDRLGSNLCYHVSELTVDRPSRIAEQTEEHRIEVDGLTRDYFKEVEEPHRVKITQIAQDHDDEVACLNRCEMARLDEDHGKDIARFVEEYHGAVVRVAEGQQEQHRQTASLPEEHSWLEIMHDADECISNRGAEIENQQLKILISHAADEQIRAACAHSLELMTIHVARGHEIAKHATKNKPDMSKQPTESSRHLVLADHKKMADQLELMRLRLIEEEEHNVSLARAEKESSETSLAKKKAADAVTSSKTKINELQVQLQATKGITPERAMTNACNKKFDRRAGGDCSCFNTHLAADFVVRCEDVLQLPEDNGTLMLDDIVESVEPFMEILQHFELLQPKLDSLGRPPTDTDAPPTLKNKVTAVITFVEELQLLADFAQNILNDESTTEGDPGSNESSRSSLEALCVLTRAPSPALAFDELQIGVDVAVDDRMQELDQNLCRESTEEDDRPHEAFFASPDEKLSSSPRSPFLSDSLMGISLVMSDYHRLLAQTTRWMAKSRQNESRSHAVSLGTEISRLVQEHCALLSLSRRLFRLKDPRRELVSLLEGVALLQRMTGRLTIFQKNSDKVTSCSSVPNSNHHSESSTSLSKGDNDSVESLSRPVLASIEDIARHLQDYDYFLQQIKLDEGLEGQEKNIATWINIESLVQEINERVMIVGQSQQLLGFQSPLEELPVFLVGAQEVLRQAKQIRESSVRLEKNSLKPGGQVQEEVEATDKVTDTCSGLEAALREMDAVIEDLQDYNDLFAWLKQALPQPESVKSVADLKDRVKEILTHIDALTTDNLYLEQDKEPIKSGLEQMEETQDHLMKEASQESELLRELAALEAQALLSPVEEVSTRIELIQALIKQQQRACDDAQQRRADMKTEAAFLRQHDLLSEADDPDKDVALSVATRLEIYSRLLQDADRLRAKKTDVEVTLKAERNVLESLTSQETQWNTEKLESVESELAQTRQGVEKALAQERVFLGSTEVLSSIIKVNHDADGSFSRLEMYQQLHDKLLLLLDDRQTVENCAAQEFDFLRTHKLLSHNSEAANGTSAPTTKVLSRIRLEMFQRLVNSLAQLHQHEEDLTQENDFLKENSLAFDLKEHQKSRFSVYQTLLVSQNTLIEEKLEREVAFESAKAFLASHGVPAFEKPMEIYEAYVKVREKLSDLSIDLKNELRFLAANQLCSSSELSNDAANLATPFASSFRLKVYQKMLKNVAQARESIQEVRVQLSQTITDGECKIASLASKIERLEASLMGWQESAYASQQEWDRMLLEEEDRRRSLIRYHDDIQKQTAAEHVRVLEEITTACDNAIALAAATNAKDLEEVSKGYEKQLATDLHRQAQQLELAAYVHKTENAARRDTSDSSTPSTSAAQSRAQLLEKFAKRDATAINLVYKAIRLTTEILSVPGNTAEVSTDVTQTVLACVKELKALKEFLVQSFEQIAKDIPPPLTTAPYDKWMGDAVTRATADKEYAIDLALCSHREFMSFAEVQLLTRQEEMEKALAQVYEKLRTAAINGGFTPDHERMLALELEVTRERQAQEIASCKFRLNEEYYRKLLEECKQVEIAQAANVKSVREECKALRLKLEKLEHQIQQQTILSQFRPPSSNLYSSSARGTYVSPETPRVLKTTAIFNISMPMRPKRPKGGGNAHKEQIVSDLERETGQRHTTTARRFNEWRARAEGIAENSGSELEEDSGATQGRKMDHVLPPATAVPATVSGSSLHNQELWYQGARSIHYVSFFISIFLVPRQQLFRVEVFNSDTEQQQQTVHITWTEMQTFLQDSRKAARLGIALCLDPEMAVTIPQNVRADMMDVLFERVRVYGEGTENSLLGFE